MSLTILLIIFILIIQIAIFIAVLITKNKSQSDLISNYFEKQERALRHEFLMNRDELSKQSMNLRNEVLSQFNIFSDIISRNIAEIGEQHGKQLEMFAVQLKNLQANSIDSDIKNREQLGLSLKSFEESARINFLDFNEMLRQKIDSTNLAITTLNKSLETGMDKMRETLQFQLRNLQEDNSKKLEEMRNTVDEKLQSTLEKRLSESFKQVSERLELVHKGLGEMQTLANGVGDLKKVLSNVKTRGILGEVQLENILEQILTQDQYLKNVYTKPDCRENVEFAIKIPGKDDSGKQILMPIDSKFPLESYYCLLEAYDSGDNAAIQIAVKSLESAIKKVAKDIRDKYIEAPHTTDFGIMFLPVEGLYAEVVRRTNLLEILQRDYKIIITGPTTLAAILHSLQMGFRTLAIEKRSSEVWKVLSAVKTEFGKFNIVLKKAQEKLSKASEDIDNLVGTRSRQIQYKLQNITSLPTNESTAIFADNDSNETEPQENDEEGENL